jgi:hypothetical protein
MTAKDHNKTFVIIYTFLSVYFAVPIIISPFIIKHNLNSFLSPESGTLVLIATIAVLSLLLSLVVLMLATALNLYRRRERGRRLALISAVLVFPLCPPVTIYTWWFMHSEGARQLYAKSPAAPLD